ncbi:unnamed protein product [Meloidogyne enterolobii]|uniref:Uncharacterized protein n=1 Tax=Meloidogyne enterolobii TaxID=390850 RepID=A0ACB1A5T4_MELEN
MKFTRFLHFFIFNWVLWTFVKTVPIRKSLAGQVEKDYTSNDVNKSLNDVAASSVNPQIQKYKETLKPKLKITKKDTAKGEDRVFKKSEYDKEYYRKNKERLIEKSQNYRKQNKEKIIERKRKYNIKNKEKISQTTKTYRQKNKENLKNQAKIYYQNNKEKLNENKRKYRQKKKNVQSAHNEGTSFVNPQTSDFTNLVILSIVCEEEVNLLNQEKEVCNNGEENQIKVEEPRKIHDDDTNQVDSNKKILPFDLNGEPEDGNCEVLGNGINKVDSNERNYLFDLNDKPENEEVEDY